MGISNNKEMSIKRCAILVKTAVSYYIHLV